MARTNSLLKDNEENLSGRDTLEGLTAIISIKFPRPEFTGQTKSKLGSAEAKTVVENITYSLLTNYFEKNAGVLKEIVFRAKLAAQARNAAKKQSDLIKRKGLLGRSNRMPGKLSDCNSNKREDSELFIVEGDSAAGSAKDGRNPETQAILPIRGKIINSEKRDLETILKNKEIQNLIIAIGTGIRDEFDLERLRYHKIIIMSDADDDGHHISTLLLTFFYRYMKPLVAGGFLYLAQPPLFCMESGKKKSYYFSDAELKKAQGDSKNKVVRFKGLGEMDAEQLADTTMDPEGRHLIRLNIDDAVEAERMVTVLMGSDVLLRKEHIKNQVNSLVEK
jgi:DNA gyrase subunit B